MIYKNIQYAIRDVSYYRKYASEWIKSSRHEVQNDGYLDIH